MDDLVADFTELLDEAPPDEQPQIDVSELVEKKEYKVNIIGYWGDNHLPIILQRKHLICCIGSKRKLLLINTNYEGLEKHSHLNIRTNKKGEIDLSTANRVFDCILKHQYPTIHFMFVCVLRLLDDDDPFKEFILRKKSTKKQRYHNIPKKKK